ncbi:MAG: hypothetical protein L0387_00920 [Acidobacteria bacterium]|nr:hypothetical protein [Acidobacteriota bacterium]
MENFPNLAKKGQSPEFRNFVEKAEAVEELRNAVQHMDSEIHKSAEAGNAVWGTLTWVRPTPEGTIYTCLLVSGAIMAGGKWSPINPAGLTVTGLLDHVTLTLRDVSVNLSDVMSSLARLVERIEGSLMEAFEAFPDRAGSDLWIALAMQPGPNNSMVIAPLGQPAVSEQGASERPASAEQTAVKTE